MRPTLWRPIVDTVGNATWNAALLAPTTGRGSGEFVVAANTALHDVVLHFNVASLLTLGRPERELDHYRGGVSRSGSFNGGLLLRRYHQRRGSGSDAGDLHPELYRLHGAAGVRHLHHAVRHRDDRVPE